MKLYTINATPVKSELTDEVNDGRIADYPKMVAAILTKYGIDGFTLYKVDGFWQGISETSFKIEIAIDEDKFAIVSSICAELRNTWNQDAVMLTHPDNDVEFI